MEVTNYFLDSLAWLKNYTYFGNTAYDYIIAAVLFAVVWLLLKLIKTFIVARLAIWAEKTKTDFDNVFIKVFQNISWLFLFVAALYIAMRSLTVTTVVEHAIKFAFVVIVVYESVRALQALVNYIIKRYLDRIDTADTQEHTKSMIRATRLILNGTLWVVGAITVLANLGVDVTSLVASLGIGGIAIALAIQNILGDLFSSFSIYVDKPFRVGDFILVGDDMGEVKKIGLKTTRIQTLQGEELVISNNELTSARVHNFKRMERRRVAFDIGVVYGIDAKKLEKIPNILENIIRKQENAEFDRSHFREYGDSSLIFETVFYANTADYNAYMDMRQAINLEIYAEFAKEKIEFAYPTQTIYTKKG